MATQNMIARFAQWQERDPESVAADATYGTGEFLQWLREQASHRTCALGTMLSARTTRSTVPNRFTYLPESDSYRGHLN